MYANNIEVAKTQEATRNNALIAWPTPTVRHFLERKTLVKWSERFDNPSVITYVYFYIGNELQGYYVVEGKPASAQNYLIPEYTLEFRGNMYHTMQAPDIDGTYGQNNPGYRFFTVDGRAIELSGYNVSVVISDYPLKLNCSEL